MKIKAPEGLIRGSVVKELRLKYSLGPEECASLIGVSHYTMWMIENGQSNTISYFLLCRIAKFYGVSIDDITDTSKIIIDPVSGYMKPKEW